MIGDGATESRIFIDFGFLNEEERGAKGNLEPRLFDSVDLPRACSSRILRPLQ